MARDSAPKVVGRLVGAHVALPVAGVVFCVAAVAGIPVGTAVVRSTVSGVIFFLATSWAVRLLMIFVIGDWRRLRSSRSEDGESDDA